MTISRRDFIFKTAASIAVVAASLRAPAIAIAGTEISSDPSALWMTRLGQQIRIDINTAEGISAANYLLRDVQENQIGIISFDILRLLAWQQAYLALYDRHQPIRIHSGLRMPATNRRIKEAARGSEHLPIDRQLRFRAVDYSVYGVDSIYMSKLAAIPRFGGVGFYPQDGFTHVDSGRQRYWLRK